MTTLARVRVTPTRTRWAKMGAYLSRSWPLYLMMVPAIVQLAIFRYYPMYGAVIAFQDYNPARGFVGSPWVGLKHFRFLFAAPDFRRILWNSLFIAVSKIVTLQLCAVALALMLNEVKSLLFKRSLQTVIYLPHFLSWVVLGGVLLDLLSAHGLVGRLQRALGMEPILFLGSNVWFRPLLIITNLWKEMGWAAIIYLAALTAIDPQLYEAAAIDGASRWQRMVHVTLPGIRGTVVLVACLNLGNVLQAGFAQVLNLYNPVVYRTADILDTYVYRQGLVAGRYSLASAVGLFKSAMGFVLIVIAYRLADKLAGHRVI